MSRDGDQDFGAVGKTRRPLFFSLYAKEGVKCTSRLLTAQKNARNAAGLSHTATASDVVNGAIALAQA